MPIIEIVLLSILIALSPLAAVADGGSALLKKAQINEEIDEAFESIFHMAAIHAGICRNFPGAQNLTHSFGISPRIANELADHCGKAGWEPPRFLKIFRKAYIVVDVDETYPFESWTSPENKTYLYLTSSSQKIDLVHILLHELAIALDGKMGLNIVTYKLTSGFNHRLPLDAAVEARLKEAFARSYYLPIAFAFSTLRAFEFEQMVFSSSNPQIQSQAQCASKVRELAAFFKKNQSLIPATDSFQEILFRMMSDKVKPQDLEESLAIVLDPDLRLPSSGNLTFCEYMTRPGFEQAVSNFFASGPRPRTNGGWGLRPDAGQKSEEPK